MNFWNIKSAFYSIRGRFLFKGIVKAENQAVSALLSQVESKGRVLDIGTGLGNAATLLDNSPDIRIGIDKSLGMLQRCRHYYNFVIKADALCLPFREQSFSLALCVGLPEYIADRKQLLDELSRILAKEGKLVYTISPYSLLNRLRLAWGSRLYFQNNNEAEGEILAAGFRIIDQSQTAIQRQYLLVKIR